MYAIILNLCTKYKVEEDVVYCFDERQTAPLSIAFSIY